MRQEFTAKIKAAAFLRSKGQCEACTRKLYAGDINYDHANPDGLTGKATLDNCTVLCRACHRIKTTTQDVPAIARAKRRERKHIGIKSRRTITRWRKFNGEIVNAPRER